MTKWHATFQCFKYLFTHFSSQNRLPISKNIPQDFPIPHGGRPNPRVRNTLHMSQPSNMDQARPSSTFLGLPSIKTSEIKYPMQNGVPQGMTLQICSWILFSQNNSAYITSALLSDGPKPKKELEAKAWTTMRITKHSVHSKTFFVFDNLSSEDQPWHKKQETRPHFNCKQPKKNNSQFHNFEMTHGTDICQSKCISEKSVNHRETFIKFNRQSWISFPNNRTRNKHCPNIHFNFSVNQYA